MNGRPSAIWILTGLGVLATVTGVFLVVKSLGCEGLECILTATGWAAIIAGVFGAASYVRGPVGLIGTVLFVTALLILGGSLAASGAPLFIVPPLALLTMLYAERRALVEHFFPRAEAGR